MTCQRNEEKFDEEIQKTFPLSSKNCKKGHVTISNDTVSHQMNPRTLLVTLFSSLYQT